MNGDGLRVPRLVRLHTMAYTECFAVPSNSE